ncbi:MAG TPA: HAMP domain-containing histidine kinase, partial [Anaerolineales bacterium]|nr:HAMP domain-containing histidine kinase [Anaerolineales bacterium]
AFVGRVIPAPDSAPSPAGGGGRQILLFVSPESRLLMLAWFAENLLPPLVEAGLVALVLSVLLAWLVARSVSRPLERVATAAGAIAQGDLTRRAPVSGPKEVQDLARAFNRMAARVAATQQAQRDLVANVSHELKTPLTSVQGFSQAILDGTAADPAAVERAARVIHDEAERMRRMVDGLLSLARFDAGQVQMAQEPVDLGLLLARCLERLGPQAEAAGDELSLSAPEGLVVTGDHDWLTQVFVNLLDNGIRHTQNGRVEVAARRVGDTIEVTVTDTGEGIPAEDLSRIFERFYQADRSRRRKGGVGLGLSIAREVVQLHGGEITAASVVGLGSRFTVRLPVREGGRERTQVRRRGR